MKWFFLSIDFSKENIINKSLKMTTASVLVAIPFLSLSTITHSQTNPADVDIFCSGVLIRSSGLIEENISRFSGEARSQLTQVSSHFDNNGNLLLMRGLQKGGNAMSANGGSAWANDKVGSNVLLILKKGSEQNSLIMNCLRRTNQ